MKTLRNPIQLVSTQLGLITERLVLIECLPFDCAQYQVQADALINDIQSAQIYFIELKQWEMFGEIKRCEGKTLEQLLEEMDYLLAVILLQTSSLRKGFPQDEDFYRHRLGKLSGFGEKLKEMTGQLGTIGSRYYF